MEAPLLGRICLCVGLLAPVGLAHATDALPIGPSGPYGPARATLLAHGFRPVPAADSDISRCSAGRRDVCAAYPETVSCSGTGAAPCRFIFKGPQGAALTVAAEGPDVGHLRITAVRRSSGADVKWQQTGR